MGKEQVSLARTYPAQHVGMLISADSVGKGHGPGRPGVPFDP